MHICQEVWKNNFRKKQQKLFPWETISAADTIFIFVAFIFAGLSELDVVFMV